MDGAFPQEAGVELEIDDFCAGFAAVPRVALDGASAFAEGAFATCFRTRREGGPIRVDAIDWAMLSVARALRAHDGANSTSENGLPEDGSGAPLLTNQ